MSRVKVTPDADVLTATIRVISRVGPTRLTLADVAADAGLAPATLLQRFGSKRGLLLAVAEQSMAGVGECFARGRGAHRSPLAGGGAPLGGSTHMWETAGGQADKLSVFVRQLSRTALTPPSPSK